METTKARSRRILEGFFVKYISGHGIDIGSGGDPLTLDCDKWDLIYGQDAKNVSYIENEKYDWVYCMAEGSSVITKEGFKNIEDVVEGDLVWTHKSRWMPVIENVRFDSQKELFRITTYGNSEGVLVTGNHPIFVNSFPNRKSLQYNKPFYKSINFDKSKFVNVTTLEKTDLITTPLVDYVEDKKEIVIEASLGVRSGWGKVAKLFHSSSIHVKIDNDIMRLVGYFLSDGSMYRNNQPIYQIGFHFNKKEIDYINDVEKIVSEKFDILPTDKRENGNCLTLRYCSKKLYDILLGLLGEHCDVYSKRIPSWALWVEPSLQMELITGFFRGDGTKNGRRVSLSTVSKELAKGLQFLLLRNNFFASFHKLTYDRKKEGEKFRGCGWLYSVNYIEDSKCVKGGLVDDNKLVCRIRKIEKENCSSSVYGLRIQEDESYYAELLMNHNSSHCLEDLDDPGRALQEWWRILKNGGYLILYVPAREYFEFKKTLPSFCNANHKWFFTMDKDEEPCTLGLIPLIKNLENYEIKYVKLCTEGYSVKFVDDRGVPGGVKPIAWGEFSLEAVVKKLDKPYFYLDRIDN